VVVLIGPRAESPRARRTSSQRADLGAVVGALEVGLVQPDGDGGTAHDQGGHGDERLRLEVPRTDVIHTGEMYGET